MAAMGHPVITQLPDLKFIPAGSDCLRGARPPAGGSALEADLRIDRLRRPD
jgi:hypothetical protein